MVNANVKHDPNHNPNPNLNPYPTLNQKPNHYPHSTLSVVGDIITGAIVARANVGSPKKHIVKNQKKINLDSNLGIV